MKAIWLAIALLFLGLAKLSAATLDTAALDRALKFGMDFQTGLVRECAIVQFTNGEKWQVLIVYYDAVELKRWTDGASWRLHFNNFDDMSRILLFYHADRSAPACIIFD
jgi:hypothetical protein